MFFSCLCKWVINWVINSELLLVLKKFCLMFSDGLFSIFC